MNSRSLPYYLAYAALVVGAFTALVLSPRPLSATIVTLALFAFNLAAIVFIIPQLLGVIGQIRSPSPELNKLATAVDALSQKIDTLVGTPQSQPAQGQQPIEQTTAPQTVDQQIPQPTPADPVDQTPSQPTAPTDWRDFNIPQPKSFEPANDAATFTPTAPTISDQIDESSDTQPQTNFSLQDSPSGQMGLFTETSHNIISNTISQPLPDLTPAKTIRLLVNAHTDDDSVLCLRGEGANLDWQEGVPMTYIDNDVWTFEAKSDAPVVCQVYLNDEIAAFGEDITVDPGQTLEISPKFPPVDAN